MITILPALYFVYTAPAPPIIWDVPAPFSTILMIIGVIGSIGLVISIIQIDVGQFLGTAQVLAWANGDELPVPTEPLQIKGLYRLVRHPLYLFSLMTLWTITPMTTVQLAFNAGATAYFLIGSYYEEKRLVRIFGDDYVAYQQQVPWMFPLPRKQGSAIIQ